MFDMEPDKAPGPDDFNPGFYQRMWNDIGGDVTTTCRTWLMEARIPIDIQATTVVLLPKVPTPETMQDLCPISLCNVSYMLVAKVLANRLRRVMQRIIGGGAISLH
ncbi:LINE-1 retrotransposable element ORF2 protein [Linum grandiflorum]